ncbi:glycosyl transferase family 90 [Helicobacter sp. 23-1044]
MARLKNNYLFYNLKGIARMLTPFFILPLNREKILRDLEKRDDLDYIKKRVDYYCQMSEKITLDSEAKTLDFLRWTRKKSVYFFDTYEYARYFPQNFRAHFAFGDVNYFLQKPSFTKSRPIRAYYEKSCETTKNANGGGQNDKLSVDSPLSRHCEGEARSNPNNIDCHESLCDSHNMATDSPQNPPFSNSTLLNMEKIRHFIFINDSYAFETKVDKLFYRGGIYQPHRTRFFEKYFAHPRCDLGHTGSKSIHSAWQKPKVGIAKHLPYKFLLSLEGNDVASNLKWVMSSNSLAIAPKMKFETWFMEGRLKGGEHFVEISDDYSDLEEKLEYFATHPREAKDIIRNAHEYVAQFFDKKREAIISLLVLEKYFYFTGQIQSLRI